jgi:hypothetical protein
VPVRETNLTGISMRTQEAERRAQQSKCDREAEQNRRDEKRHDEARFRPDDFRVLSFKEWCRLCGFSPATGRRIINAGNGPIITQLSPRRIGITLANYVRWQESRARGAA